MDIIEIFGFFLFRNEKSHLVASGNLVLLSLDEMFKQIHKKVT